MQAHVNLVMSHDVSHKGAQGGLQLILYIKVALGWHHLQKLNVSPWAG